MTGLVGLYQDAAQGGVVDVHVVAFAGYEGTIDQQFCLHVDLVIERQGLWPAL